MNATLSFLGIGFWNGRTEDLLVAADREGGLFTVPSAPSLAQMQTDPLLATSYRNSDWAVVDGGYVALILRLVFGKEVKRISGLQILQKLISPRHAHAIPLEARSILWVVPNGTEQNAIRNYMLEGGFDLNKQHFYEAPFYRTDAEYSDGVLMNKVKGNRAGLGDFVHRRGAAGEAGLVFADALRRTGQKTGGSVHGRGDFVFDGNAGEYSDLGGSDVFGLAAAHFPKSEDIFPRYFKAAWQFPQLLWACRKELFARQG